MDLANDDSSVQVDAIAVPSEYMLESLELPYTSGMAEHGHIPLGFEYGASARERALAEKVRAPAMIAFSSQMWRAHVRVGVSNDELKPIASTYALKELRDNNPTIVAAVAEWEHTFARIDAVGLWGLHVHAHTSVQVLARREQYNAEQHAQFLHELRTAVFDV